MDAKVAEITGSEEFKHNKLCWIMRKLNQYFYFDYDEEKKKVIIFRMRTMGGVIQR